MKKYTIKEIEKIIKRPAWTIRQAAVRLFGVPLESYTWEQVKTIEQEIEKGA